MRYYYEKPKEYKASYGRTYHCNHKLYSACTLYEEDGKGLAVIQQRFNPKLKVFLWGPIDPWLVNDIFLHKDFSENFSKLAAEAENGLYPTISIRKLMWKLRMKPLRKEWWENSQN